MQNICKITYVILKKCRIFAAVFSVGVEYYTLTDLMKDKIQIL